LKALNSEHVHWISSVSTFAGIASALVHKHTLNLLQNDIHRMTSSVRESDYEISKLRCVG
jgi:hypothetical protein